MSKKNRKDRPRGRKYTPREVGRGLVQIAALLIILALVVILFVRLAPYANNSGISEITVTVEHTDADAVTYSLTTGTETLGEALSTGGLLDGDKLDGESGAYVCSANGGEPTAQWQELKIATGDSFVMTPAG